VLFDWRAGFGDEAEKLVVGLCIWDWAFHGRFAFFCGGARFLVAVAWPPPLKIL